MGELFPDGLVVAVGVVEQRQHEQCLAVLFAECVVDGFERVGVGALGQVCHRAFGFGFVVGWVAEDVDLVERHAEQGRHTGEQLAVGFDVVFGEDSCPNGGAAEELDPFVDSQVGEFAIGRP